MYFSDWGTLLRLVGVGVPAYLGLIMLLRIGGKRTLSKFNAFDFVVTVAYGSILATALLSTDVALVDVLAAMALLVALQFLVTWSSVHWPVVDRLVKSEPQLLFHRGAFLGSAMDRERIAESEVLAAIRSQGFEATGQVESVVLETDGTFSVVSNRAPHATALEDVRGHPDSRHASTPR